MKRHSFTLLLTAGLFLIVSGQTTLAQKVVLYMTNNQVVEYSVSHLDSIKFIDEASWIDETGSTLWEMIKGNPNYSRFSDILKHAKYYRDNTHPVSTYTFADILNGGQILTIWAPDNDALTEEEYQRWMTLCDGNGYSVHQQFLGNHIATFRHNISEPGIEIVRMINGKKMEFDKTNRTIAGIPLGEINIPATNGVMHVLKGVAPFRYNFYEYLKFREQMTEFGKYVIGKEMTYFSPDSSIEGPPDENGNPTYIDSVFYTVNPLLEYTYFLPEEGNENWQMAERGFGAPINNEDSVFIMIIPTDAAWNTAYEMLKESHVYATTYDDKSKGDLNTFATINGLNPNSLQNLSIAMDIISPLVFNIHKQPKRGDEIWTLDMFKTYKGNGCEYLLNTFGDTLRNVGAWNKTSLFDGEPIEMSNGLAFEVNSWNFPREYFTPDVEVEIENTDIFYNIQSNKYKVGANSKRYTFSNDAYKNITDKYGKVSNNNFYHLDAPGPTLGPKVEIKLYGNSSNAYVPNAQVMSGKYDIQVVVVPRWYIEIANASMPTEELDTEYVKRIAAINQQKFRTQISYSGDAAKDKTSSWVTSTSDGLKVDTITIAEDFEFPYSYRNMRFTYPTLIIEGYTTKNDAKNGFVYDLVIDKIILKRKY